jgi:hypothetical protein
VGGLFLKFDLHFRRLLQSARSEASCKAARGAVVVLYLFLSCLLLALLVGFGCGYGVRALVSVRRRAIARKRFFEIQEWRTGDFVRPMTDGKLMVANGGADL